MKAPVPDDSSRCGAFTLIELMVSSALLGLIMFVLLAATSTSLGLWRNSEKGIAVDREGRNALMLISDDLANMLPVASDAPDSLQPRFAVWDDLVFMEFLVRRPRDYQDQKGGNTGDICYVRYRYRDNKIERASMDSVATLEALRDEKRPDPDNFEILADNLPSFFIGAFDSDGIRLNPEGSAADIRAVRTVDVSLASLDAAEMESRRSGASLRDRGTSLELLSSMKYFSVFAQVPRP